MGSVTLSNDEKGFGLIEAVVGLSILAFGLLGVAAAFAQGMRSLAGSNYDILAREKAVEAVESVYSSRDTKTIAWAQIRNVVGETGDDGGVFLDGQRPLTPAGPDGLVNTRDDSGHIESLVQPGPDDLLGTGDDIVQLLTGFTREIEIRQLTPTLRRLRVVVRYKVGMEAREYEVVTYISSYA
jgi:hypothetical protein